MSCEVNRLARQSCKENNAIQLESVIFDRSPSSNLEPIFIKVCEGNVHVVEIY